MGVFLAGRGLYPFSSVYCTWDNYSLRLEQSVRRHEHVLLEIFVCVSTVMLKVEGGVRVPVSATGEDPSLNVGCRPKS